MLTQAVALFGAGVASFLAPCLVPLLPAYLGLIAGEAVEARDPARAVPATLLFVLGFSAVFSGLGAAAGLLGSALTDVQNGVQRGGGVVVLILGLALLGVIRGPLVRDRRPLSSLTGITGPLRPVVIGIAFGAAWSPCVGPLLGAALTVAASPGAPAAAPYSSSPTPSASARRSWLPRSAWRHRPGWRGGCGGSAHGSSASPADCWSCSACCWPRALTGTSPRTWRASPRASPDSDAGASGFFGQHRHAEIDGAGHELLHQRPAQL